MATFGGRHGAHGPEDDADGCDLDFKENPTLDVELPASSGGVQAAPSQAPEDDVDAADVLFSEDEPTSDVELPAATGGVA